MARDLALSVPCPSCGGRHPKEQLTCPQSGDLLPLQGRILDGKFQLLAMLGQGGMSTVWRAENLLVRKRVAIKMMLPELLGNANTLQRFRNEATAAGRIGNRHICDILDLGTSRAGPYIVMEMLRGRDLARLISDEGALAPGVAVWILRKALLGLAAAHEAGIIHRDLKPENLFLHEPAPGQLVPKLMDFGISKFSELSGRSKTATGVIMGTPGYMSPEQIEGAANADERADIWAVGVMLYAAVSGYEPFPGETFAKVLLAVTTQDPQPLHERLPSIDPKLSELCHRCLAKDPSDRFASCAELSAALLPFETPIDQTKFQVTFGPDGKRLAAHATQDTAVLEESRDAADAAGLTTPLGHPDKAPAGQASPTARRGTPWEGELVSQPAHLDQMAAHPGQPLIESVQDTFKTRGPSQGLSLDGLDSGATQGPREGLNLEAVPHAQQRGVSWQEDLGQGAGEQKTRWSIGQDLVSRTFSELRRSKEGSTGKAILVAGLALLLIAALGGGVYAAYVAISNADSEDPALAAGDTPQEDKPAAQPSAPTPDAAKPSEPQPQEPSPQEPKPPPQDAQPSAPETDDPVDPEDEWPSDIEPTPSQPKPTPGSGKPSRPSGQARPGKSRPRPKQPKAPASVDQTKVRKMGAYFVPRAQPPSLHHAGASAHCASLRRQNFGGLRQWQLPSTKWLMQQVGRLKPTRYWSKSRGTRSAKAADLGFGKRILDEDPGKKYRAMCVARR